MSLIFTAGTIQLQFDWRLQFGAVSIFLAWFNLILFIRKFPVLGIYVVMFIDIFNTFVKFFVIFMLFLTAFGLAFFVLLQNHVSCIVKAHKVIWKFYYYRFFAIDGHSINSNLLFYRFHLIHLEKLWWKQLLWLLANLILIVHLTVQAYWFAFKL